jgi:drug/metabolite transporter (DMT)-like permease
MPTSRVSSRALTFWAFAAIYLIWGSTYLAIRFAVHSMPPFFLAGVRFLVAGGVLYAWARMRGERRPGLATWRSTALAGTLFFLLGNGLVVWAEQRVPSGRTALLASTSPIWTVLIESAIARWQRPPARVLAGVLLGFVGLALLASPTEAVADTVPLLGLTALIVSSFAWALGSVYTHHQRFDASPAMSTAMKMLGGGAQLAVLSIALGEWRRVSAAHVAWDAWAALAYLIVFGSLVGFSAFTYLLRTTTPQKVATAAYVNPVVALVLGWLLGGETVTGRMITGAGVIVASVLLVRLVRTPEIVDAGDLGVVETGEHPAAPPGAARSGQGG